MITLSFEETLDAWMRAERMYLAYKLAPSEIMPPFIEEDCEKRRQQVIELHNRLVEQAKISTAIKTLKRRTK